jgi:hypothetical protein
MTIFTGHSVNIHPDAAGSAVLMGGITQMDADIGTEINSEEVAGSPYAQNTTISAIKPKIMFSTRDIAKSITACGLIGLTIKGSTNPGLVLWQAQIANGVVAAGSLHKNIRMPEGRLMIRKISVSHQEDAQADLEAVALYDGTNLPFIPSAANQALPGVPADPARYTLHSVSVGGVAIPCVQSLDIDFGLTLDQFGCDSDVWDTHLLLSKIQPIISIRTLRPSQFLTTGGVPLFGLVGTHANTVIKLRKRATGASPFVADATAEHISITTAGLLSIDKAFSASGNKRGEIAYRITSRFDGTNVPLIFSTTATLP